MYFDKIMSRLCRKETGGVNVACTPGKIKKASRAPSRIGRSASHCAAVPFAIYHVLFG